MRETAGSLWDYQWEDTALVIPTNGRTYRRGQAERAIMGAGVAKDARDRFPGLDIRLAKMLTSSLGNRCFVFYPGGQPLVTFPTKHAPSDPSDIDLIQRSAVQLAEMTNQLGWATVVLPRVGCGLGRLDWERDVRPVLAPILDNRFIVVAPKGKSNQ